MVKTDLQLGSLSLLWHNLVDLHTEGSETLHDLGEFLHLLLSALPLAIGLEPAGHRLWLEDFVAGLPKVQIVQSQLRGVPVVRESNLDLSLSLLFSDSLHLGSVDLLVHLVPGQHQAVHF